MTHIVAFALVILMMVVGAWYAENHIWNECRERGHVELFLGGTMTCEVTKGR